MASAGRRASPSEVESDPPDGASVDAVPTTGTAINGQPRQNLAAFDVRTGTLLPWRPASDGRVRELEASGTKVYVAGEFTRLNGATRRGLGALDAATGVTSPWNPDLERQAQFPGTVHSLEVRGDTVYVGGRFDEIGGASRKSLAAVDAETGVATSWAPAIGRYPYESVCNIAVGHRQVYAGGNFEAGPDRTDSDVAAFDIETGKPSTFTAVPNLGLSGSPCDEDENWIELELVGNTLYAGGTWSGKFAGERRVGLAALDATSGRLLPWDPARRAEAAGSVLALANEGPGSMSVGACG